MPGVAGAGVGGRGALGAPPSPPSRGAPPRVRLWRAWAEHVAQWEVLRCLIYSRPGEGVRTAGSEQPKGRVSGPHLHTMPCPRVLAALCGALLCASGLFAFSGESIAPPSRPRPSSPRRSEVRRRALPLLPLFTNLVKEPAPSGGATSPAAPGREAGMLSASPAVSAPEGFWR